MRSRFIARPRGVETLLGPLLSLVPLKPDIWNRTSFVMFTATASSSLSGFLLLGEGMGEVIRDNFHMCSDRLNQSESYGANSILSSSLQGICFLPVM
ncbi:hypothetical protein TNCT_674291 [Trichonephila clavata]|uniref:Uncharacterized protein n=1 Tax=Trichonephila clavata TaxID=2740835 RepID=A0A8X6HM19_TRICU|nr:hypothetical protein TNCT_674291 [Trichonephila clavata]